MPYNAKLLLFGEHIVLQGAQALAIPWAAYQGTWKWAASSKKEMLQQQLPQLLAYLEQLERERQLLKPMRLAVFAQDLEQGIYFDSNIPIGYGAGSSGALCAAIYARYCSDPSAKTNFKALKQELGQIESFFHGSSSGTDPLICYLNQAILIQTGGVMKSLNLGFEKLPSPYQFFVIDTGIRRQTGPYVKAILKKAKEEPKFKEWLFKELIPVCDNCIEALLAKRNVSLFNSFRV